MASSPTYNFGIADDGMEKRFAPLAADGQRTEYLGKAIPGTLSSANGWQIQKWTYDGNGYLTNIKFANNKASFEFDWDSRVSFF